MRTSTTAAPRSGSATAPGRGARPRRFLMCPPTHFDVTYAINPWMDPTRPVDRRLAQKQWDDLVDAYRRHGQKVETMDPRPDLPDMVYAANGGFVLDGIALAARFRYPERRGEEDAFARWFAAQGLDVHRPTAVIEGEGDLALAGDTILAGTGFRTSPDAHEEVAQLFQRRTLSLVLVDPRFYHLDTALCVLDDDRIMYYPGAFSEESRRVLARNHPDAILASEEDAIAFGLNATSDGHHVFLNAEAEGIVARLDEAGYEPVPVDLSEIRKGGGSVKCCTLELRT